LVEDFKRDQGLGGDRVSSRVAVLSLFGMMNWIYTWHDPRRDTQAADVAEQMSEIFLRGLAGNEPRGRNTSKPGSVGNHASQKQTARRQRTATSTI
jgi:hypothetical protein